MYTLLVPISKCQSTGPTKQITPCKKHSHRCEESNAGSSQQTHPTEGPNLLTPQQQLVTSLRQLLRSTSIRQKIPLNAATMQLMSAARRPFSAAQIMHCNYKGHNASRHLQPTGASPIICVRPGTVLASDPRVTPQYTALAHSDFTGLFTKTIED